MLKYLKIPREHGDCVVLLLAHPGTNLLGRYLPTHKVNDLLLVEPVRTRPPPPPGDVVMRDELDGEGVGESEGKMEEYMEGYDIMDLASFLEYVLQLWLYSGFSFSPDFLSRLLIAWKCCTSRFYMKIFLHNLHLVEKEPFTEKVTLAVLVQGIHADLV
jgi:hypothetical protein